MLTTLLVALFLLPVVYGLVTPSRLQTSGGGGRERQLRTAHCHAAPPGGDPRILE
jgi:hypothetical protein